MKICSAAMIGLLSLVLINGCAEPQPAPSGGTPPATGQEEPGATDETATDGTATEGQTGTEGIN